jgi:acyl carrier protein
MQSSSEKSQYVYQTARKIITSYLRVKEEELKPDTHIVDELGADSLALVELGFQISETFDVPMMDTSGNKLVFRNLVEYILANMPEEQQHDS